MDEISYKAEWIETEALIALHEATPLDLKAELSLTLESINGVTCSACLEAPSILLNRALGYGLKKVADETTLEKITSFYRNSGIHEYFLQITPDSINSEVLAWLTKNGLKKNRGWMKFVRHNKAIQCPESIFEFRKITPIEATEFARVVIPAFDMPEQAQPLIANLHRHPRWHLYGAFSSGSLVGTGALFIKNQIAYYDWAATAPKFREQGCQSGLLRYLISEAINSNCHMMVSTTGEAWPDDPQHSYHNILKTGFKETYVRENWSLT